MTEADLIEALLDLVDDARTETTVRTEALLIRGYAARKGRGPAHPTTAGWNLLGDRGRPFDVDQGRQQSPLAFSLIIDTKPDRKNAAREIQGGVFDLGAGAGFEPATFRL